MGIARTTTGARYSTSEDVYMRKCQSCNHWFGTLRYEDRWCCTACEEADRRRMKEKLGRKARIIKRGEGNA